MAAAAMVVLAISLHHHFFARRYKKPKYRGFGTGYKWKTVTGKRLLCRRASLPTKWTERKPTVIVTPD